MEYYTYKQAQQAQKSGMDATLQKYFPTNEWGCDFAIADGFVTICRVDGNTWTHYANIQKTEKGWELNEQFMGEHEDEMFIYGYYKTFGNAVRNLATKGVSDKKRKPIEIYK